MSEKIMQALSLHRQWKARLIKDLEAGHTTMDPTEVRRDDRCALGNWIYEEAPAELKADIRLVRVRDFHRAFHLEAARVVELIRAGQLKSAKTEMESGRYATSTLDLVRELSSWAGEFPKSNI